MVTLRILNFFPCPHPYFFNVVHLMVFYEFACQQLAVANVAVKMTLIITVLLKESIQWIVNTHPKRKMTCIWHVDRFEWHTMLRKCILYTIDFLLQPCSLKLEYESQLGKLIIYGMYCPFLQLLSICTGGKF